jgi:hypothetical protein
MLRLLIGLPFLALALLAPAPATTSPIPKNQVTAALYYPTKVGTRLVYDRKGVEETYVVTEVGKLADWTVVTTEQVEITGLIPYQKALVSLKGLFLLSEGGAAYDPTWLTLRLPHNPGAMWETTSTRRDGLVTVRERRTAKKEEMVKTPAGEFLAVVVESENLSCDGLYESTDTRWYAPEVGLVRLNDELVLKSFTLGK